MVYPLDELCEREPLHKCTI